jgi:hypothetical protein
MQTQDQKYDSSSGCLIHLFWLIVGNVALLIVAGQILFHTGGRFSVFDAIYWLFVVLILAARYADIRFFKGTTVDGKPSTLEDLRRHATILIISAGVIWITIHLFASNG